MSVAQESHAESMERRVSAARGRSRQDKKHPQLICVDDYALFPNVPNIRKKNNFIIYTGDVKASLAERKRYVESMKGAGMGRRGVISSAEPFDVATATKEELIDFALVEYETTLNGAAPMVTLRRQVLKLAHEHDALVNASAGKTADTDLS